MRGVQSPAAARALFQDPRFGEQLLTLPDRSTTKWIAVELVNGGVRYALYLAEQWYLQSDKVQDSGLGRSLWEWHGPLLYHTDFLPEVSIIALHF